MTTAGPARVPRRGRPGRWTTGRAGWVSTLRRPGRRGQRALSGRCPTTRTSGRMAGPGGQGGQLPRDVRVHRPGRADRPGARQLTGGPAALARGISLPSARSTARISGSCPTASCSCAGASYERETAWAPMWAGDQLRQVRVAADTAERDAVLSAARAEAARKREELGQAQLHDTLAASQRAMAGRYREPGGRSSPRTRRPGRRGRRPPGSSGTTPWPRMTSTSAGIRATTWSR